MKRRGTRIVSSSRTVADAARLSPSPAELLTENEINARASASTATGATALPLTIPTLDIFARFQSHRDDFDADWLLLQENPEAANEKSPLATAVTDKLRRHQAQLGANRAAAARQSHTSATSLSSSAVAQASATPRALPRRPDTYDSDDEDEKKGHIEEDVAVVDRNAMEEGEEGDYQPQDQQAVQYHRKAVADEAMTHPQESEEQQKQPEGEEGLIGDYLDFSAAATSAHSAYTGEVVEAIVHLPLSAGGSNQGDAAQQRADGAVRAVPLWSAARMESLGGYCATNSAIALHQEVTDLFDFLRPTEGELLMRRYVEHEVSRVVTKLWPNAKMTLYGSMVTHQLLPTSDLDLRVMHIKGETEVVLTALAKAVKQADLCEDVFPLVIAKTRVPLIKFTHKGSLMNVDISIGDEDAQRNSFIVRRYLHTYPEALPLSIIIKYFLHQRLLDEPYHGGLGSYATTLLVVAFLRQHPIYTIHPEERAVTGLGRLLTDFFSFLGAGWRASDTVLHLENPWTGSSVIATPRPQHVDWSLRSNETRPIHTSAPHLGRRVNPGLMAVAAIVMDPGDGTGNVTSALRCHHIIREMCCAAYMLITADLTQQQQQLLEEGKEFSPSSSVLALRPTMLSRVFHVDAELVRKRRTMAEAYAALCEAAPSVVERLRSEYELDDAAMMPGFPHGWRAARESRHKASANVSATIASRWERAALAELQASRKDLPSPSPSVSSVPATDPAGAEAVARRGEKRHRIISPLLGFRNPRDPANGAPQRKMRIEENTASEFSSSRSSSSVHSSNYDNESDGSGSNASSVRVDVSKETGRARKMRR